MHALSEIRFSVSHFALRIIKTELRKTWELTAHQRKEATSDDCDCEARLNFLLPCHHVLAALHNIPVPVSMIHKRWLLEASQGMLEHLGVADLHSYLSLYRIEIFEPLPVTSTDAKGVDSSFSDTMHDFTTLYQAMPDPQQRVDLIKQLNEFIGEIRSVPIKDPESLILPTSIKTKGRPQGTKNARIPSSFERKELEQRTADEVERRLMKETEEKIAEARLVADKQPHKKRKAQTKGDDHYDEDDLWYGPRKNHRKDCQDMPR